MVQRGILVGSLVAVLIIIAGCGGQEPEEGMVVESVALGVTGAACTEADLSKPSVCEGPWEYLQRCYAYLASPACGPLTGYEQKQCSKTCALPQFGTVGYNSVFTARRTYRYRTWEGACTGGCGTYCVASPSADCDAYAKAQRDQRNASYGGDLIYALAISRPDCGQGAPYTICDITIKDPVYNQKTDPACGTYSCDDTTKPIYPSCRASTHPLDANVYACGPQTISAPNVGQPVGDLAYTRCTTADDLSDPKAKFNRLKLTLDRLDAGNYYPTSVDTAALKNLVVGKLELLLELHGEALDPVTQVPFIQALYGARPTLGPSCGTRLTIPDPPAPTLILGFPDPTPLAGWTLPPATSAYVSASQGWANLTSYQYLPATLSRSFTIPPSGGVLSFRYRATCGDGWGYTTTGGSSSVSLTDTTTGTTYSIVPAQCDSGGERTAGLGLGSLAGHTVTLKVTAWDNGADGYGQISIATVQIGTAAFVGSANGGIVMCDRLTQAHVSQPAAMTSAGACLDTATKLHPLAPSSTINSYLDAAHVVVEKALKEMAITDPTARRAELTRRLQLVQRWYASVKALYPATSAASLWQDASAVSGAAVRGAHSSALDAFCGSPRCSSVPPGLSVDSARLQSLLGSTFEADRDVLAAAFPPSGSAPLTGAPLALVVANAMEAASNRLASVAPLHDVACLAQRCSDTVRTTSISQTVALLGHLHDPAGLASALTGATLVPTDWKAVFSAISARHVLLENALADAELVPLSTPSLADVIKQRVEAPPLSASLPLLALSERIGPMKRLADHYAQSQTFVTESANLQAGLDRDALESVRSIVQGQLSVLTGAVSSYRLGRRDAVLALVSEIRAERDQQSVRDRLLRGIEQAKNLANDLAALRAGATLDDRKFAGIVAGYEKLLRDLPQLAAYRVDPAPLSRTINASDAKYQSPGYVYTTITELAAGAPITAGQGDVLRLDVGTTWSPSCAVTKIGRIGVGEFKYPLSFTGADGAITGPEGYSVTYANGSYGAFSTSKTNSRTDSACIGISAEAGLGTVPSVPAGSPPGTPPTPSPAQAGAKASASVQSCSSTTRSTTWANGTEERLSATFTQGLRLPNTPFPEAPAGALLLVRMPAGETALEKRLDVIVVHPQFAMVVPTASDLYFVVNDLKDASCGVTGSLTVSGTSLRSVGTEAQKLSAAMGRAMGTIAESAAQHVSEGRLLPATVASLKSKATTDLEADCGCDLSTYPAPIQGFFGMWVDAVLARAERQVEAANILRQLNLDDMELRAVAGDLVRSQREGALLRLIPEWALVNVDEERLVTRVAGVSNATAEALFPYMRILYPETFDAVATNRFFNGTSAAMEALLTLDWTKAYDDAADKLAQAVGSLMLDLGSIVDRTPRPGAVEVAVSFVRPGASLAKIWHEADSGRSAQLWAEIGKLATTDTPLRVATIRIQPEDVYAASGGLSGLTCAQSAPVIRTMGLYIATPTECTTFNAQELSVPVYFGGDPMRFPTGAGLESFRFDDLYGWLNPSVSVNCGSYEYARVDPGNSTGFLKSPGYLRNDGAGLSPFGDITLDLRWFNGAPSDYDKLNQHAQALVVWFKVEPRLIPTTPTTGGVRGVVGCPAQ